ncbi:MAG TPA: type III pantothenate kinase [Burkholderiales bacterium]|nr:type III pantothenate kinase [Burkholderiales bacterium]
MRILAVDAGNSRIKWGVHEDGSWLAQGWVATRRAAGLSRAWARIDRPDLIIAANVAGARVARALTGAARRFKRPVRLVASTTAQCGVRNSYANPRQLGPDRWAALIGAWNLHRGPCVVVNAGTTVTVDALDGGGVFLGGLIIAGAGLMRDALGENTARLRPRPGRFAFFPSRTADAIESGAVNALAGAVERMVRFMREAGAQAPLTVLSGGAAQWIAPQLNGAVEVVDNLVLEGLVHIAQDRK